MRLAVMVVGCRRIVIVMRLDTNHVDCSEADAALGDYAVSERGHLPLAPAKDHRFQRLVMIEHNGGRRHDDLILMAIYRCVIFQCRLKLSRRPVFFQFSPSNRSGGGGRRGVSNAASLLF